jgi:hypothetical protein
MSLETLRLLKEGKLSGLTRLDLSCELTEFPREIFNLADSLEILNLTGNRLSSLPDDLGRLHQLRILFCSENEFTHLPAAIGGCPSLSMIGFKANRIATIDPAALPPSLRWLTLTDNCIREVPASIGRCPKLQKLLLSGNRLQTLPPELAECQELELLRLAANDFFTLPEWLLEMPRLCWLALAGNPWEPTPISSPPMSEIIWSELQIKELLGEGASGWIHRALWKDQEVAVKLFKGAVTSDGLPAHEMLACISAGQHPNLIKVLGKITQHPAATEGLVMSLIRSDFKNLAGPPSFTSCTRDVYPEGQNFSLSVLKKLLTGLASAGAQLHARGLLHGDFYAHNVLWNEAGDCLLGDFGAAAFLPYDKVISEALQKIEVRAFGILMEELLTRVSVLTSQDKTTMQALVGLQKSCTQAVVRERPLFSEVLESLR